MTFSDDGNSLAWKVGILLRAYMDGNYPLDEIGKCSLELSNDLRSLSIMALLAFGDQNRFFRSLTISGEVREKYLRTLMNANIGNDYHQVSSRNGSLFDSISAGAIGLSLRIISLTPTRFFPGQEYEDDYCYSQIVHHLLSGSKNRHDLDQLLKRFETCIDGQSNVRFNICKALVDNSQKAFDRSFSDFLCAHEDKVSDDKSRGQLEDPVVVAQRLVSIESLAILQIALFRGLKTEIEYPFCPSIARFQHPYA